MGIGPQSTIHFESLKIYISRIFQIFWCTKKAKELLIFAAAPFVAKLVKIRLGAKRIKYGKSLCNVSNLETCSSYILLHFQRGFP